jgi:hypothetical protein
MPKRLKSLFVTFKIQVLLNKILQFQGILNFTCWSTIIS